MSEEMEKIDEPQETHVTQETQQTQGTQATQSTLAALAEAQSALTEKDDRISELEASLAETRETAGLYEQLRNNYDLLQEEATRLQSNLDATGENLVILNDAAARATQKYLEAVRVLNAGIPGDLIDGATIAEIDDSVEKAQGITDAVRASLAAEARNARVPAGAPTRAVNLDGLDAREKITLGLAQQKG